MDLFRFEPGNGTSYRVLFGKLPGSGLVPAYTVFGIAEGDDALITAVFDTPIVSFATFSRRFDPIFDCIDTLLVSSPQYLLEEVAWPLFMALLGHGDAGLPPAYWRPDWRDQLPA